MSWYDSAECGCKINLRLKVTARRSDGFHEISTLFWPLDFPGDTLEISGGTPGISLQVPEFPELENNRNLVYRAAEKYSELSGIPGKWHFTLHKKAPVAAGLGGGSADAAAVLRLLNTHYQALSENQLAALGLSLGADVPFFLTRRAAWAAGVGEKLTDAGLPEKLPETVIVYPGFPVSAKWAYCNLSAGDIGADDPGIRERFAAAFADPQNAPWQELFRNDLAPALWKKFPLLTLIKNELLCSGARAVQVSGSGSSLFAVFPDGSAENAASAVRNKFRNLAGLRIFAGGNEW